MAGGQRRYLFDGERYTIGEVCDLLDLYSIDDIQEQMAQGAFGKELDHALGPYLKKRIKKGMLGPNGDADTT